MMGVCRSSFLLTDPMVPCSFFERKHMKTLFVSHNAPQRVVFHFFKE